MENSALAPDFGDLSCISDSVSARTMLRSHGSGIDNRIVDMVANGIEDRLIDLFVSRSTGKLLLCCRMDESVEYYSVYPFGIIRIA